MYCLLNCAMRKDVPGYDSYEGAQTDPVSESAAIKMMDRALALLVYNECVPLPVYAEPLKAYQQDPHKILATSPLKVGSITSEDMRQDPNLLAVTSAFAATALDDSGVDRSDLSGWDLSMSPFQETLELAAETPARQTLFLGDAERQTVFMGGQHSHMTQPTFKYLCTAEGMFVRNVNPEQHPSGTIGSGWTSIQLPEDAAEPALDQDWVIA